MKIKAFVPALLLISASSHADTDSNSKTCDGMATLAVTAVQAKNNGIDFITFSKKIDGLDSPDSAKAAAKYLVAKAYSGSTTPEDAYSSTYMDCMISLSK